jgi:hypothetical protein|tara:strand:+ start:4353 stop:4517 length:165 start_codon:yes stop_codon:yes gene_type:complete
MKEYLIKFTLKSGDKDSLVLKTEDIDKTIEQIERNRDIKSFDLIKVRRPRMFHS